MSLALLSPVTVSATRLYSPSLLLQASARPKPRTPTRRRAPVRRSKPKPPPRRRAPARRPPVRRPPIPRIPLRKLVPGIVRKAIPWGRVVDAAEYLAPYYVKAVQDLMGGPIIPGPPRQRTEFPFRVGPPLPSLGTQIELPPVTVSASRLPGASPSLLESLTGQPVARPSTQTRTRTAPRARPSPRTRTRSPTRPLTPSRRFGVPSARNQPRLGSLTLSDLGPQPKADSARDRCPQPKKRDRSKCPDRGFRRVCTHWRNEPCQ